MYNEEMIAKLKKGKTPRKFYYGETPFNEQFIYANECPDWVLGAVLTEAIKLELNIPNANEDETNRAITLFLVDCLIKYISEQKAFWETLNPERFKKFTIFASNAMLDMIDRTYDDEHFDNMCDLMNKHKEALIAKFGEEAVESYWEK